MNSSLTLTSANSDGTFANNELTIGEEKYSLAKVPPGDYSLVLEQKYILTADLNIADMMDNLALSAQLIYLAYCGVTGTGKLAANLSNRQRQLLRLMSECTATIGVIRDNTSSITEDLLRAFQMLGDKRYPNEAAAIAVLTQCGVYARAMATKCNALAGKVHALSDDISADAGLAELQIGEQTAAVDAIRRLQADLKSTLAQQKVLAEELKESILALQEEISEAKQDEKTESERAFILGIVSAVTGAIGSALGAYAAVATKTKPSAEVQEDPAVQENTKKLTKAKKELQDLKAEEEELEEEKEEEEEEIEEQEGVVKESKATIAEKKAAKKGKTGAEAADLEKEIVAAEAAEKAARTKQEEATKRLTAVEAKIEAQNKRIDAASAAMLSVQASLDKQTDVANRRAESARSLRLTLMQQKREDEKNQREALGLVAGLTEKLKAAGDNQKIAESSLAALEITNWALNQVFVSLSQFEEFWEHMATYCEALAQNRFLTSITEKSSWKRKDRLKWFQGEDFARGGIGYVVNWQALHTVSLDYLKEATRIKKVVEANISKAPSIAEARQQLPMLHAQMKAELAKRNASSEVREQDLEAAEKWLTA